MSKQQIIENINKAALKSDVPAFEVGDTLNVHCRIVEGDKERTQVYQGVLISKSGSGINTMIRVRRVVDEVGIERVFPVHSPMISKFEILRRGDARRAKLYFLRDRVGKSRRLRDRRRRVGEEGGEATTNGAAAPAKA